MSLNLRPVGLLFTRYSTKSDVTSRFHLTAFFAAAQKKAYVFLLFACALRILILSKCARAKKCSQIVTSLKIRQISEIKILRTVATSTYQQLYPAFKPGTLGQDDNKLLSLLYIY